MCVFLKGVCLHHLLLLCVSTHQSLSAHHIYQFLYVHAEGLWHHLLTWCGYYSISTTLWTWWPEHASFSWGQSGFGQVCLLVVLSIIFTPVCVSVSVSLNYPQTCEQLRLLTPVFGNISLTISAWNRYESESPPCSSRCWSQRRLRPGAHLHISRQHSASSLQKLFGFLFSSLHCGFCLLAVSTIHLVFSLVPSCPLRTSTPLWGS